MTYQILVVDDEPDMQSLIQQKLRRQIREKEFEFFFSPNGEHALQTLGEQPGIDLVMTDINMPVMDGLTLLGRLNDSSRRVKTVIVSAYGDMANIRTAMNRGALDFLLKPIDFEDFEVTVRKGLAEVVRTRTILQTQNDLAALQYELNVAAQIQQWSLPRSFPPYPDRHDFDLHAAMATAKGVSGDLFDFFLLDHAHLGFVIGDVRGNGIAAALVAAVIRTLMRATAVPGCAPGKCLEQLHTALVGQHESSTSVSLFYGVLNTHDGGLQFCNDGHPIPYVFSERGGARPLRDHDAPQIKEANGMGETKYYTDFVRMKPGDGLLLYTDGVTGARNKFGERFGSTRLEEHASLHASGSMESMILDLYNTLRFFSGETAQTDDMTALALRYRG